MDPFANLKEQLELAREIQHRDDETDDLPRELLEAQGRSALRLAELVLALDEWMRKGGFSPWKGGAQ